MPDPAADEASPPGEGDTTSPPALEPRNLSREERRTRAVELLRELDAGAADLAYRLTTWRSALAELHGLLLGTPEEQARAEEGEQPPDG